MVDGSEPRSGRPLSQLALDGAAVEAQLGELACQVRVRRGIPTRGGASSLCRNPSSTRTSKNSASTSSSLARACSFPCCSVSSTAARARGQEHQSFAALKIASSRPSRSASRSSAKKAQPGPIQQTVAVPRSTDGATRSWFACAPLHPRAAGGRRRPPRPSSAPNGPAAFLGRHARLAVQADPRTPRPGAHSAWDERPLGGHSDRRLARAALRGAPSPLGARQGQRLGSERMAFEGAGTSSPLGRLQQRRPQQKPWNRLVHAATLSRPTAGSSGDAKRPASTGTAKPRPADPRSRCREWRPRGGGDFRARVLRLFRLDGAGRDSTDILAHRGFRVGEDLLGAQSRACCTRLKCARMVSDSVSCASACALGSAIFTTTGSG